MSVAAATIVPRAAPPRRRIGAPERLGRNAARTLVTSQGHVMQARGGVVAAVDHANIGSAVAARAHLDATLRLHAALLAAGGAP